MRAESIYLPLFNDPAKLGFSLVAVFADIKQCLQELEKRVDSMSILVNSGPQLQLAPDATVADANKLIRQMNRDLAAEIADTRNYIVNQITDVRNEITATLPLVNKTKKMEDIEAIDVHQEITDLYDRLREAGFDI